VCEVWAEGWVEGEGKGVCVVEREGKGGSIGFEFARGWGGVCVRAGMAGRVHGRMRILFIFILRANYKARKRRALLLYYLRDRGRIEGNGD
jgi:hypothetical protein